MLSIDDPCGLGSIGDSQSLGLFVIARALFKIDENAVRDAAIFLVYVSSNVRRALLGKIALITGVLVIIATAHKCQTVEGRGVQNEINPSVWPQSPLIPQILGPLF